MREEHIRLPKRFRWQQRVADIVNKTAARFIVIVVGRRAGKTECAVDIAGECALEGRGNVFWGAPTYDISEIGRERFKGYFKKACSKINDSKPPFARLKNGIEVLWRSFDRAGAALGRGTKLVIIDEGARVKKQIVDEEVLPTIADTGGKVLVITTPRGRRNWVHRWYLKAKSGNPLYAYIRGPSTANPNPAIRQFIADAKGEMPDHLFRQEILAEFIEGEGTVFRNIARCASLDHWLDRPPSADRAYIVGADVAKHQDYTVLIAIDIESGECHGFDRFNQLDWPTIEARIKSFACRWNDAEVWLDSTGVGDPVFDHLCDADVEVCGTKFTNESKSKLVTALSTSLDEESISYPDDNLLTAELESVEYTLLPSGRFRYAAAEGFHDDIAWSLALATYGRNRAVTGVPV